MKESLQQAAPWVKMYAGATGVIKVGPELILHNGVSSEAFNYAPLWANTFTRIANEAGLPPNLVLGCLIIVFGLMLADGARHVTNA